jgi:hypothetical protein
MVPFECFGERPACARCVRKDEICMYDVAEGVTRQQDLRARLDSVLVELDQMRDLFYSVQHSSDTDAMVLFMRIRSGEDVTRLVGAGIPRSIRYVCFSRSCEPFILTSAEESENLDMRTSTICDHTTRQLDRSKPHRYKYMCLPQNSTIPGKARPHKLLALISPSCLLPIRFSNLRYTVLRIYRCTLYRSTASTTCLPMRARVLSMGRELTGEQSLTDAGSLTCKDAATDVHVVVYLSTPMKRQVCFYRSGSIRQF